MASCMITNGGPGQGNGCRGYGSTGFVEVIPPHKTKVPPPFDSITHDYSLSLIKDQKYTRNIAWLAFKQKSVVPYVGVATAVCRCCNR